MKRLMIILFVFAILGTFGFAQEVGPTWIDSGDTANMIFPTSILAFVSNGAFTDEIDIVIRSPLALSEYDGYGIFTLYGNYSSPWGVGYNNPFTTTVPQVQMYQFGATMPINDAMRAGVVGRYWLTKNPRIVGGLSSEQGTDTDLTYETVDPDATGRVNITQTEVYRFDFAEATHNHILAGGLATGNHGFSLYAMHNETVRTIGGSYTETYRPHADFDPAAMETTLETYGIGRDDEGGPKWYPANGSWNLTALGQLPLALIGSSSPVTGFLRVTGETAGTGALLTGVKTVYSRTDTDYTDPGDPQTVTSIRYGEDLSGAAWNPATVAAPLVAPGDAATTITPYYDLDGTKRSTFGITVGGGIDPVIPVADRVTLNSKAHVALGLGFGNASTAQRATVSVADGTQTWKSTWVDSVPEVSSILNVSADLGGTVSFRDAGEFLTLSTGVFLQPGYSGESTRLKDSETVLTRESTGAALLTLATGALDGQTATVAAGAIDAATAGTSRLTTLTTYTGSDTDSTLSLGFAIPTSVRMDFFDGKLSLVGGYNIRHSQSLRVERDATLASTTTSAVVTSGGTIIYDESDDIVTATTETEAVRHTPSSTPWTGQMGWMLRWQPTPSLTVDLDGQGIMTALDMDIFGGGTAGGNDGFNLRYLIDSLTLSASYRF